MSKVKPILILRAKCAGCTALKAIEPTEENKEPSYRCKLGFKLTYDLVDNQALAPKPQVPCYKPIGNDQYRLAMIESGKQLAK